MNTMSKFVVSSTLREPAWENTVVLQGDPVKAVAELKEADGGPILVAGSHTLVQSLLGAGLVDRLRLMTFPVAIGGGLRVFPEARQKTTFILQDTMTFPSGVTV